MTSNLDIIHDTVSEVCRNLLKDEAQFLTVEISHNKPQVITRLLPIDQKKIDMAVEDFIDTLRGIAKEEKYTQSELNKMVEDNLIDKFYYVPIQPKNNRPTSV